MEAAVGVGRQDWMGEAIRVGKEEVGLFHFRKVGYISLHMFQNIPKASE